MSLLAANYQTTRVQKPRPLSRGLDRYTQQLAGGLKRQQLQRQNLLATATAIHRQSLQLDGLSDQQLQQQLIQLRSAFRRQRIDTQQLHECLALLSEVAFRLLKLRPYPVQILAALILDQGGLVEMATGEGKSLVICLGAVLAGWSGKPCHVITANDYLAARDAEFFAPVYQFCGLTTGAIADSMTSAQRRQQYLQAIVYVTAKELLADFLRDRLLLGTQHQAGQRLMHSFISPTAAKSPMNPDLVLRGIDTAIVDEADNILIDEATTPLILSQPRPNPQLNEACRLAHQIASQLIRQQDYVVEAEHRDVRLTKAGEARIDELTADFPAFFRGGSRSAELILQALTAEHFFKRDSQYVVEDEKVVIVDEFTGRKMAQRTWRQGLHQLIEIKEDLPLSDVSETLLQLSFQDFFCLFRRLSGATGTAWETRDELWQLYRLPVVQVPANRPCQRQRLTDRWLPAEQDKLAAIVDEVGHCQLKGQPVLIGTRSVAISERLGQLLTQAQTPHQILNAIRHQEEAEIIATAGGRQAVTVATNMAGRGADIPLGPGVSELGGLHVVVTEHHDSKRIDRQLIGRCARQGAPGSFRVYACMDDELFRSPKSKQLRVLLQRLAASSPRFTRFMLTWVQNKSQRLARKQRQQLAKRGEWLNEMLP